VSPIAEVLTKGFDDGSQEMSVKTGTMVAGIVEIGTLVGVSANVEVGSICVRVGKTEELQPASNNAISNNKL
jgi:hypothetical protein